MTDDFDLSLRNRLESVASAVPVDERRPLEEVRAKRVDLGRTGRRRAPTGVMTIAAIAATGVLIAGVLQVGPFAPATTNSAPPASEIHGSPQPAAPSPDDGPQVGSDSEGPYSVEIRSGRRVYRESEAIDINAVFTYSGDQPASVRDDAFFPLTFGIRESVHGLTIIASQPVLAILRPGCRSLVLQPDERYESKFRISAFSPKPQTEEQQAFLADPELHLPPGTWHFVVESSVMGEPPCPIASDATADPAAIQSEDARMSAEIEIVVTPDQPDGTPSATDTEGPFSLTVRSDRQTYLETDPINIDAALGYAEGSPSTMLLHRAKQFVGFRIQEPVYGMDVGTQFTVPAVCGLPNATAIGPGDEIVTPFEKGGSVRANDPDEELQRAFLADPILRLPPGVWHISSIASFSERDNGCDTEFTSLEATIEIDVLPAPVVTNPPPTYPAVSPGPVTDVDGVEAIQDDGTFRVRLASPKTTWLAGEIIDIETQLTYLGPNDVVTIGGSDPFVSYSITQLDGPHLTGSGGADVCTETRLHRQVPLTLPFLKGGGYGMDDPDRPWLERYTNDRSFRLTPGTWEIGAQIEAAMPGCDGTDHDLRTGIVIKVVDAVATGGPTDPNQSGGDRARAILRDYAAAHPESFGAIWIDQSWGTPARLASSWTRDIETHRAWLEAEIGSYASFALYDAEYTDAELQRVTDQIHDDLMWLDTLPAAVQSLGGSGRSNRVELEVSSAVPDARALIRAHYAAKFGFDPAMLIVQSDGTGASFVDWGTVHATLELPAGGLPNGVDLMPGWEGEITGLRCGHGDAGVGFEDLPCQQGRWANTANARRDEGDWEIVGSTVVDVVAGRTTEATIKVERWP
jgi:hypothetical protein